jgi:hypothetical protein
VPKECSVIAHSGQSSQLVAEANAEMLSSSKVTEEV